MKTYMALDGLRWSRDSGSANCDMPRSAVFGRPGGGLFPHNLLLERDAIAMSLHNLIYRRYHALYYSTTSCNRNLLTTMTAIQHNNEMPIP